MDDFRREISDIILNICILILVIYLVTFVIRGGEILLRNYDRTSDLHYRSACAVRGDISENRAFVLAMDSTLNTLDTTMIKKIFKYIDNKY